MAQKAPKRGPGRPKRGPTHLSLAVLAQPTCASPRPHHRATAASMAYISSDVPMQHVDQDSESVEYSEHVLGTAAEEPDFGELGREVPDELIPPTPPSLREELDGVSPVASVASSSAHGPAAQGLPQLVPHTSPDYVNEYKGHLLYKKMALDLMMKQADCKRMFDWLPVAIADSLNKNGEFTLPLVCKFYMTPKRTVSHGPELKHDLAVKKVFGKKHIVHTDNLQLTTCVTSLKRSFVWTTTGVVDQSLPIITLPDAERVADPAPASPSAPFPWPQLEQDGNGDEVDAAKVSGSSSSSSGISD